MQIEPILTGVGEMNSDKVKKLFTYDKSTGIFVWKESNRGRKAGEVAGCKHPDGYVIIRVYGKNYQAHRLAWLYVYGVFPDGYIDHINGVRDDNRICNLRDVTQSENMQNIAKARKDNKIGILGVRKRCGKYQALITNNGKQICLGTFDTVKLASDAYLRAKREMHVAAYRCFVQGV